MGKKKSDKKKSEKKMPIGVTLLLILLVSAAFVAFCVGTGLFIDAVVAFIIKDVEQEKMLQYVLVVAVMGSLHLFFFVSLILGRMPFVKKKEGESYREDIMGMFSIVLVLSAVFLIAFAGMNDRDIDLIIAAAMLPTAGFIVSPAIIKHELKSQKKWDYIFYTKGNLHNCKNDDDFYRMDNPVPFETSIFFAVIKQQVLGTVGVIAFIIVSIALTIFWITYGYNHMPDNLLAGLFFLRLRRKTVVMFSISVFFIAFGPAIASFYFTGFIYRLMIVMKRKYIACHAIVRKVDSGKISLSSDKYHYSYNYATCVGILEKNVHDTPATLIFVPDNVYVFPDEKFLNN